PPIIVEVGCDHTPSRPGNTRNFRTLANSGKYSIAVIVKEPTRHRVVEARDAISVLALFARPAGFIQGFGELHELAHKQIEFAVVVVVEPHGAGGPAGCGDSRFLSHIRKRAIAVVVVQDASAVLRDVDVREAVTVIIAHRDALAVSTARHASLLRYV